MIVISILFLSLLISGCQEDRVTPTLPISESTQSPSATPPPASPSPTRLPSASPTPNPTQLPGIEWPEAEQYIKHVPIPGDLLTAKTAQRVEELVRWGAGIPSLVTWTHGDEIDEPPLLVVAASLAVHFFDSLTFEEVRTIPINRDPYAIALSPDGRLLAVGFENGLIQLFQVNDGKLSGEFDGQTNKIINLVFSPLGDKLASSAYISPVMVWSIPEGEFLYEYNEPLNPEAISFSPDGRYLVVGGEEMALLLDAEDGTVMDTLDTHGTIQIMDFSPTGKQMAAGLGSGEIQLWNWDQKELFTTISAHEDLIICLDFSADDAILISGSADNTTKLWNTTDGELISVLFENSSSSAAFSPPSNGGDSQFLATIVYPSNLLLFQAIDYSLRDPVGDFTSYKEFVDFHPDNTVLLSTDWDGEIHLVRLIDGGVLPSPGIDEFRFIAKFSPDGVHLAADNSTEQVALLDLPNGNTIWEGEGLNYWIETLVFSPDSAWLASIAPDDPVQIWNTADGSLVKTLSSGVSLDFSPDGKSMVMGTTQGEILFFDLASGDIIHTIQVFEEYDRVSQLDFSSDGTLLAAGSNWTEVVLINVEGGDILYSIDIQENQELTISERGNLTDLEFSPDGTILATSDLIKRITLWDVVTGEAIITLDQHTDAINDLVFSPNGYYLASASDDGTVRIFGIPPGNNQPTPQPLPTITVLPDASITPFARQVPQVDVDPSSKSFPVAFPLDPPSQDQIEEARACDLESLAESRYPDHLTEDELRGQVALETACDWAALVAASTMRLDHNQQLSDGAKDDFAQLMNMNPAFAFHPLVISGFFNAIPLVENIPLEDNPITDVSIEYGWSGMGDPQNVSYKINISDTESDPVVEVTSDPSNLSEEFIKQVDTSDIQALGLALTDFLEVNGPMSLVVCTDNFPDWSVTLTFKDGKQMKLKTNGSNFLGLGGPWQTEIDGRMYTQYSVAFTNALGKLLIEKLNFQPGEPDGMYCDIELLTDLFDQAYP